MRQLKEEEEEEAYMLVFNGLIEKRGTGDAITTADGQGTNSASLQLHH